MELKFEELEGSEVDNSNNINYENNNILNNVKNITYLNIILMKTIIYCCFFLHIITFII